MKLISYCRLGVAGFGAVVESGIVDLTGKLGADIRSIRALVEADLFEAASRYVAGRRPELTSTDVTFLPVIPDAGKILCVGLNYAKHQAETGRPDVPHPTIFTRFADSHVGHGQPLVKPRSSDRFDFEGELAVIIGRGGRSIPENAALGHVAGYACYNDGSVRDWQRHTSQFTPGKNFAASGSFGPFLVTADEIEDYTRLPIETRLNGEVMQKATLADLIFPIPRLISYISEFTPLSACDVIVTGTPGGVGDRRDPPVYMKPGDIVEIDIGPVGTLVNPVMAETDL